MNMKALIIFAIFVGCALAVHPPHWPHHWSATWNFVDSNSGALLNTGAWYYDASSQMLRQDNDIQCEKLPKGVNCSAVFKNNNIYFNVPSTGVCCLCWTGIPITQPNWLVKLNATYAGRDVYPFTNVQSTLWNFDSQGAHVYYQGYKHKLPVAERGWGTDMQWVDIVVQKPDSHVFDLPSSCQGACDATHFHCDNSAQVTRPQSVLEFLHNKH
jgi:hypothetical protein